MLPAMKAGIYGRVSIMRETLDSDAQPVEATIDRQFRDCLDYAERQGWTVARTYRDEGISAFSGKVRPDFERLVTDVDTREVDVVVCWKLDRLCRSHGDFQRLWEVCERRGARLVSLHEMFDSSTPAGEFTIRMMVGMAMMESQNISLRVARARLEAARHGLPVMGGARPYGYADDKVTIVPREARVLRLAAGRVVQGRTLRSIARKLNRLGLHPVNGGRWNAANLRKLLLNPRYIGVMVYKGEELGKATWPPILDVATFEQVRTLLSNPGRRTNLGRPPTYLLVGGLARCFVHDMPLQSRTRSDGRRYACNGGDREGGRVHLTIAAEPLERLVTERVLDRLDGPSLARFLHDRATEGDRELADGLVADEKALRELHRARFVTREVDHGAYLDVKAELEQRVASARAKLSRRAQTAILAGVSSEPGALRRTWAKWTLEQRRQVLRVVIPDGAVVKPATRLGRRFDPDRVDVPIWRA